MVAIILAGGFGTRLRSVVSDKPKVLALVAGKPFLLLLVNYLKGQGITRFIFSLGYMHGQVEDFLKENFPSLQYDVIVEDEPLGTGGAIKLCLEQVEEESVLIANGDTFFHLNIPAFANYHNSKNADCSMALTPCSNFDRYGSVLLDDEQRIIEFVEKKYCDFGLINTGLVLLNVPRVKSMLDEKTGSFSFEADFLTKELKEINVYGYPSESYFIDIGIPEDFDKAQTQLSFLQN
jgi:D-glycero-alpha-D-manno-heptose 1-phosphate guanylyltransferase